MLMLTSGFLKGNIRDSAKPYDPLVPLVSIAENSKFDAGFYLLGFMSCGTSNEDEIDNDSDSSQHTHTVREGLVLFPSAMLYWLRTFGETDAQTLENSHGWRRVRLGPRKACFTRSIETIAQFHQINTSTTTTTTHRQSQWVPGLATRSNDATIELVTIPAPHCWGSASSRTAVDRIPMPYYARAVFLPAFEIRDGIEPTGELRVSGVVRADHFTYTIKAILDVELLELPVSR
ncbi:hypothetical protein BDY19DRAFT_910392 [Irpex rosettiformis]|uniref:Uncharacterized protein n=1 Tax=Irpex rosettiformis TaxID=378272 RepID=A0ACB8TP07_9APHY|nr:hypothetical protein BDY19DRAFT_910392 [Irpex rosettiformis]